MVISGLSTVDYVNLVGYYNSLGQKESIDPRLLNRGFTEEQLKELKQRMNTSQSNNEIISLNIRFYGDLKRFDYPPFNFVMTMFDQYDKHGILPFAGSHSDQPAQIIDIFSILSQLKYEREQELREKERKRQEKENKKHGRYKT